MNKVMDLESGHVLAVLEETVDALELIATLPDSADHRAFVNAKPLLSQAVGAALERHVRGKEQQKPWFVTYLGNAHPVSA